MPLVFFCVACGMFVCQMLPNQRYGLLWWAVCCCLQLMLQTCHLCLQSYPASLVLPHPPKVCGYSVCESVSQWCTLHAKTTVICLQGWLVPASALSLATTGQLSIRLCRRETVAFCLESKHNLWYLLGNSLCFCVCYTVAWASTCC